MSALHLDFTQPETLHKMAALPGYGWAEALVRHIDPWWHAPEGPYRFKVHMVDGEESDECPTCGCTCGEYSAPVAKQKVVVEAMTEDEAIAIAETEHPGWSADYVAPPKFATAEVPAEFLAWFAPTTPSAPAQAPHAAAHDASGGRENDHG